ncbi:hypothetical protein WN48_09149 [Eufriesea mexicana]|nr:hypothetical protein WN48_09149 [Eufriesea mexicana]
MYNRLSIQLRSVYESRKPWFHPSLLLLRARSLIIHSPDMQDLCNRSQNEVICPNFFHALSYSSQVCNLARLQYFRLARTGYSGLRRNRRIRIQRSATIRWTVAIFDLRKSDDQLSVVQVIKLAIAS